MMSLYLNRYASIQDHELDFVAIRSQGPGGQNVNKVATAVQLKFDYRHSGLPAIWKQRLDAAHDRRIGASGTITIKARRFRRQDRNREDALSRLRDLILQHVTVDKPRKPTRPSRAARQKRLDNKGHRSRLKATRRAPIE